MSIRFKAKLAVNGIVVCDLRENKIVMLMEPREMGGRRNWKITWNKYIGPVEQREINEAGFALAQEIEPELQRLQEWATDIIELLADGLPDPQAGGGDWRMLAYAVYMRDVQRR